MALSTIQSSQVQVLQLIGTIDGFLGAFPATNQDGSVNQPAQDAAIQGAVAAAISTGVFPVPVGANIEQTSAFGKALVAIVVAYKAATKKTLLA
jgi:hypothetical protein